MNSQDHDQTPSDPSGATPPPTDAPKPRRSRTSAASAAVAATAAAAALPASVDTAVPEADVVAKPKRARRKAADAGVDVAIVDTPVGASAATAVAADPAPGVRSSLAPGNQPGNQPGSQPGNQPGNQPDNQPDSPQHSPQHSAPDNAPAKPAKPRRRAATAVAADTSAPDDSVALPVLAAPVAPTAPAAAAGTAAGAEHDDTVDAEAGATSGADSAGPDDSASPADGDDTRRRKRNRRRGRRSGADHAARDGDAPVDAGAGARAADDEDEDDDDAGDAPAAAVPRAAPLDSADTFAAVLSGDYDAEPTGEATSTEPERRVLAAEPDAPKLHKVLAQAGIGSRRDMEELIAEGQVMVNGQPAHTGQRISFGDRIVVAGKLIKVRIAPPPPRIIAYHKPVGEIVTNDDPQNRPTVYRRLPRLSHGKWQSVGRLDINTEGLLLFTNSGELANQLMHPRFGVEREYAVRVLGTLENDARARLIDGVEIDGQRAGFKSIEDGGGEGVNRWYRVVITEGRNREVRKLFDKVGLGVSRLIRIRYGCVVLPRGLRRGLFVDLNEAEVREVRRLAAGGRDPAAAGAGGGQPAAARPPREPSAQPGNSGAPRDGQGQGAGRGNNSNNNSNNNRRNGPPPQRAERDRPARPDRPERQGGQGGQGGQGNAGERPPNRQAERRERPPRLDADGEVDHVNFAAIPNPLMQTFDKRAIREARAPRREIAEDGPIPNPLEQTYDKRFVQKPRGFGMGGGGGRKDGGGGPGGQPDPMKTSMGYISADAFVRKFQGNGGAGGGGGGHGGGGGGHGGGGHGGGGGGGRRGGGGHGGGSGGGGGGGGGRRGGGGR